MEVFISVLTLFECNKWSTRGGGGCLINTALLIVGVPSLATRSSRKDIWGEISNTLHHAYSKLV